MRPRGRPDEPRLDVGGDPRVAIGAPARSPAAEVARPRRWPCGGGAFARSPASASRAWCRGPRCGGRAGLPDTEAQAARAHLRAEVGVRAGEGRGSTGSPDRLGAGATPHELHDGGSVSAPRRRAAPPTGRARQGVSSRRARPARRARRWGARPAFGGRRGSGKASPYSRSIARRAQPAAAQEEETDRPVIQQPREQVGTGSARQPVAGERQRYALASTVRQLRNSTSGRTRDVDNVPRAAALESFGLGRERHR